MSPSHHIMTSTTRLVAAMAAGAPVSPLPSAPRGRGLEQGDQIGIDWFTEWSVGCFGAWLAGWLAGWLADEELGPEKLRRRIRATSPQKPIT